MRKLLYVVPAALVASTAMLTPTPALAVPGCELEVRLRCNGYSVNQKPAIGGYDTPQDCQRAEQPLRCGTQPDEDDLTPVAYKPYDLRTLITRHSIA